MAGGKLTPRQKMINLMYLVFIAMLAMNMSKEVLSAFGLMNEKFEAANTTSKLTNEQMMASLDTKAAEASGEFSKAAITAHKVEAATKKFFDFIATAKVEVLEGVKPEDGKLPYEAMDKSENLDNNWFSGEGYTKRGNDVMTAIAAYKSEMKEALGEEKKYSAILNQVNKEFDVTDVTNKEGIKIKFLDYHFKGFPAIASLAKLSAWQSDAKKAESDVISAALGKAAVQAASYSNYQAMVILDKNAYFQGEKVTGKVVLGRYDENTKPASVSGATLDPATGQAKINLTAGAVGEQKLGGEFKFVEDGKTISLPFKGNYVVVPRPNSATIAADKMNVVYRGVVNPMTISFAGVSDNNVTASAAGLSKAGGNGKYNMSPGQGTEVLINVTGKLPDGTSVSDRKAYRIKNIPAPQGAIGGQVGDSKGAKGRLAVSQVTAELVDFDFDVKLQVTQFTFRVSGQPSVVVNGNRVNKQCEAAMARAGRGDIVTISEIKTKIEGSPIILRQTAPAFYEIQ
ncbi:gliding motility protein GldM [Flavobacterium antarcticum]|uniref:type IX secretion system motor protein PorM/GldM n=1 Tax=Flavobacterium antarcticum TaxID=271155 RepID=UPI0003B42E3C|nr:gliding motility protein GldM [Flavobacterium antarcticum]